MFKFRGWWFQPDQKEPKAGVPTLFKSELFALKLRQETAKTEAEAAKDRAERAAATSSKVALERAISRLGTSARNELRRRELADELAEAERRLAIASFNLEGELYGLTARLQREDHEAWRMRVAHEGRILSSTSEMKEHDRLERRLVCYDGKIWLCILKYVQRLQGTGKTVTKTWQSGYGNTKTCEVPEMLPTGNFAPPEIVSVDDSVAKFTREELQLAASMEE